MNNNFLKDFTSVYFVLKKGKKQYEIVQLITEQKKFIGSMDCKTS